MVENAFGILKGMFRKLRQVTETHMTILLDMVACCLLHNLLLEQSPDNVTRLLEVLHCEGAAPDVNNHIDPDVHPVGPPTMEFQRGEEKRSALGRYLAKRRNLP